MARVEAAIEKESLNAPNPIWRTRWFRLAGGTLVSLFLLYLALNDVPLGQVAEALGRVQYVWVFASIGIMVLQSWLRAVRWIRLFYPLDRGLSLRRMWSITLISQMLNIIAPWRIGDLARVYLAGEMEKRSKAQVLATLGTEKVFDMVMLLFLLIGIPVFMAVPEQLEQARNGLVAMSLALFAAALVLILLRDRLLKMLDRISIPWKGHSLNAHAAAALSSLDVFQRLDVHLELQALSLVIWILGVVTNFFALLALDLHPPWIASFMLLAVLQVGGFVPSTPGKVGVFQFLCVLGLSFFSVEKGLAFSYGIVLYVVAYGTPVVLGLVRLWSEGLRLQELLTPSVKVEGTR